MSNLLLQTILGLEESLLVTTPVFGCRLHRDVVPSLMSLNSAATAQGFELRIASSYRSFERQLLIWNNKARGVKPVLDDCGNPLRLETLDDRSKVFAILRWSALPGASRHHWGTDMDVYDASRITPDYTVQLTVAETENTGPFADFHRWLDVGLSYSGAGFYRPYAVDCGGIAPEPWHLSYAPVADQFAQLFSVDILREQLLNTDIELKATILENLDEIFSRFVRV